MVLMGFNQLKSSYINFGWDGASMLQRNGKDCGSNEDNIVYEVADISVKLSGE